MTIEILGDTELEIMQVVWAQGRVTIAEVYNALRVARPIAYTTVQTVVLRLAEKGFLHQQHGTRYPASFSPGYTKDELGGQVVRTMVADVHPTPNERLRTLAALTWGLRTH